MKSIEQELENLASCCAIALTTEWEIGNFPSLRDNGYNHYEKFASEEEIADRILFYLKEATKLKKHSMSTFKTKGKDVLDKKPDA